MPGGPLWHDAHDARLRASQPGPNDVVGVRLVTVACSSLRQKSPMMLMMRPWLAAPARQGRMRLLLHARWPLHAE